MQSMLPNSEAPESWDEQSDTPEMQEQLQSLKESIYIRFGTLLKDQTIIFSDEHRARLETLVAEVQKLEVFNITLNGLNIAISSQIDESNRYVAQNLANLTNRFIECAQSTALNLEAKELPHINVIIMPGTNFDIVFERNGEISRVFSLGDVMETMDKKNIMNIYITNYPPMRSFDNPNAYLAVVIHELTHHLVRSENPNIPRILDEAIALYIQFITTYLGFTEAQPILPVGTSLNLYSYLHGDYMAFWRGLEIDKNLLKNFSRNEFDLYLKDVIVNKNLFPGKWLEKHFVTNFTYLGPEAIEMFFNYILSRVLIAELIIQHRVKLSEIIAVKGWEDFIELIKKYDLTQEKLGKQMFQNVGQLIGMSEDELSEHLQKYYKLK